MAEAAFRVLRAALGERFDVELWAGVGTKKRVCMGWLMRSKDATAVQHAAGEVCSVHYPELAQHSKSQQGKLRGWAPAQRGSCRQLVFLPAPTCGGSVTDSRLASMRRLSRLMGLLVSCGGRTRRECATLLLCRYTGRPASSRVGGLLATSCRKSVPQRLQPVVAQQAWCCCTKGLASMLCHTPARSMQPQRQ